MAKACLRKFRRRTDLVQLVGRRVKLTRKGRVIWGCCPFHEEKSPSFKVENERRIYKCFGCGVGGDAFKWLIETEGLTFPEAIEKLAGEAGVELPQMVARKTRPAKQKKKSLYDIVELAVAFLSRSRLAGPRGGQARGYLSLARTRRAPRSSSFRLGYSPASGNALIEHLQARTYHSDDMIAAGAGAAGRRRPADAGLFLQPA